MSGLTELLGETSPEEEKYFQTGGQEGPKEPDPEPAPKEDPEPAPEPKEGEEKTGGEGEGTDPVADEDRRVPLKALHEERDRRREIQAKVDQQAAMLARLEGRFQQLLQPPQQQAPRPPSADEDPIAVLRQLEQERSQRSAWDQQQQQRAQFEQHVAAKEAEYMKAQPDYPDAAAFLQQRRNADLQQMGITDPGRRHQVLYQEASGMALNALQSGQNPAKVAYELARSWGYQPKGQEQPAAPAADQKIEMAQRAQEASGSLSASGGRPPQGLSLEAIDKMSDEDFAKLSDAKWAKAWGA